MNLSVLKRILLATSLLCLAEPATAETMVGGERLLGRPGARLAGAMSGPTAKASQSLGTISPARVYRDASFASAGVGLRNRPGGGMEVSGVTLPVKAAFVYWAVISQGVPPAAATAVLMRHEDEPFTEIRGALVARGASPCWGGDRISVFRGTVPAGVAKGNGLYRIELKPGANGSTNGEDPWVRSPLPLVEGASVVVIGSGPATVAMYEQGLAGKTFYPQLSYTLRLPVNASSSPRVLFHNTGADGQSGVSTGAIALTASEVTTIGTSSGLPIAGRGSPASESDWNGNLADPLPQLWDNTVHDITAQVQELSIGTSLPITVQAPDDCLTPVANTVVIEASGT